MKKLLLLITLFTSFTLSELNAQSNGLSPEGYKSWIRAVTIMENITDEYDYLNAIEEFINVSESDPDYVDTYYNLATLYYKVAEMGAGVPMYRLARETYNNYMKLVPSEKSEIDRLLIELEVKEEVFLERMNFNMVNIEKGIYVKKKKEIEVDAFAVQSHAFSVADYNKVMNRMAVAVADVINNKDYPMHTYNSPTGDDIIGISVRFTTASNIVEVLNVITGRNYRLMTLPELERLRYFGVIHRCTYEKAFKRLGLYGIVGQYEWINKDHPSKNKKLRCPYALNGNSYQDPEESEQTCFRLVESL